MNSNEMYIVKEYTLCTIYDVICDWWSVFI